MNSAFYICFLVLFPVCLAYSGYQDQIPNGKNVPHPCVAGSKWLGVGHENMNGGGTRNPFGLAFAAAGHQWTKALCQLDSDGDGKPNGEELGDPTCVWSSGKTPSRVANITHPGVCEPVYSAKCQGKNDFVTCTTDNFEQCDIIKGTDVRKVDLTFPTLTVPAADTTYLCMSFDLPGDKDYHIVADQPIINNSNVVHHMILYGCDDANGSYIPSPQDCEMSNTVCSSIIASWAVGETGSCNDETYGFRIGATSFKRVVLETHYNNPKMVSTYKDSSGIRLYIRPARPEVKDLFTLLTGQMLLELPPGQSGIEKVGICKSSCTSMLIKEPIYVISAANHMHYYGSSMTIKLYRNGTLISTLSDDAEYDLDSPVDHEHDPAVQILPGDEIVTRCTYDTTKSTEWVYYGESTSDEMCFGYLTAYPKQALRTNRSSCESVSTLSYCEMQQGTPLNGCDWNTLVNSGSTAYQKLESMVSDNCESDIKCGTGCTAVLKNISTNPCFQGETAKIVKGLMKCSDGADLVNLLQSCPAQTGHVNDLCDIDYGTWVGISGVTTVSTTKSPAVTTVSTTKSPAVTTVSTTKSPAVSTVSTTKSLAVTTVSTTKSPAVTTVSTTKSPAVTTVSTTKSPAVTTVSTTKSAAATTVSTTKSPAVTTVSTTKLPAVTTVGTTKSSGNTTPLQLRCQPYSRGSTLLSCSNLVQSQPPASLSCRIISESRRTVSLRCRNLLVSRPSVSFSCRKLATSRRSFSISCPNLP